MNGATVTRVPADAASSAALDVDAAPRPPTRAEAFRYWLKLGFVSFGGPAGQIAVMHKLLVEEKKWIGESRFLHAGLCRDRQHH